MPSNLGNGETKKGGDVRPEGHPKIKKSETGVFGSRLVKDQRAEQKDRNVVRLGAEPGV